MIGTEDPHDMTPQQRFQEISALLAQGILGLRLAPAENIANSPKSSASGLAIPFKTRLSVPRG
jgi:hypothetical protein